MSAPGTRPRVEVYLPTGEVYIYEVNDATVRFDRSEGELTYSPGSAPVRRTVYTTTIEWEEFEEVP